MATPERAPIRNIPNDKLFNVRISLPPWYTNSLVRHRKCDVDDCSRIHRLPCFLGRPESDLPGGRHSGVFKAIFEALDNALDFYFARSCKNNFEQNVAFDLLGSSFIRVNWFRLEQNLNRSGVGSGGVQTNGDLYQVYLQEDNWSARTNLFSEYTQPSTNAAGTLTFPAGWLVSSRDYSAADTIIGAARADALAVPTHSRLASRITATNTSTSSGWP